MSCSNVTECPCPKTTCAHYKKCCACIAAHNEKDGLPFCLFPDSEGSKSMENLYKKLKKRFDS